MKLTDEWALRDAPADVQAAGLAWLHEGPDSLANVRLEDILHCLHCGQAMQVGDLRVSRQPVPSGKDPFEREVYMMQKGVEVGCATPNCDGGVIDWSLRSWSAEK